MSPENETYLWDRIKLPGAPSDALRSPRDVIDEMLAAGMIQSPKQAWRTLEKWSDRGLYNYGVCLDLGWREMPGRPKSIAPDLTRH